MSGPVVIWTVIDENGWHAEVDESDGRFTWVLRDCGTKSGECLAGYGACQMCGGTGEVTFCVNTEGYEKPVSTIPCPTCTGTGREACGECGGSGHARFNSGAEGGILCGPCPACADRDRQLCYACETRQMKADLAEASKWLKLCKRQLAELQQERDDVFHGRAACAVKQEYTDGYDDGAALRKREKGEDDG